MQPTNNEYSTTTSTSCEKYTQASMQHTTSPCWPSTSPTSSTPRNTTIRRMNQADYKAIASAAAPAPVSGAKPGSQSLLSPRTFTQIVYPRLLSSLKILLPTSIFALKFLEWWHASDFARQLSRKAAEGLELPAPTISGIPKATSSTATAQKSGVTFATSTDEKDQVKEEKKEEEEKEKIKPPISARTNLPIFTVAPAEASSSCPICLSAIQTPTAAQTGYVFCYTCIFRWLEGEHPRQLAFMQGGTEDQWKDQSGGNREGGWEDGRGRCAVSGRRLLGGSGGLRRVMV
jgi:peroxin-12